MRTTEKGFRGVRYREFNSFVFFILIFIAVIFSTSFADELSEFVKSGMMIAVGAIIPSVFPFMIFSDFILSFVDFSSMGWLGDAFERTFHISRRALGAFIIGTLAGFPIGARMTAVLYKNGELSKKNAQNLLVISSSPSLAFAVAGVGSAMWKNVKLGLILYLSVVLSAIIYGVITRPPLESSCDNIVKFKKFDIVLSIEKATLGSINIIGTISLFSVFAGLISKAPKAEIIAPIILPFIEIGNATSYLAEAKIFKPIAIILTGFALSFSGLSVHLQIKNAIIDTDLSYKRFFVAKLAIGFLSILLVAVFLLFFEKFALL